MQQPCIAHDFDPLATGQWECKSCGLRTDAIYQTMEMGSIYDDTPMACDATENLNIALLQDYTRPPEKKSKGTYVWRYHFNERIAQSLLTGPGVPENILAWLRMYYFVLQKQGTLPPPDELSKSDIGELCHMAPVTQQFRYYYRSQAQKYNLFKTFSGYAERWYSIRVAFGAPPFATPTETQLYTLRLNGQKAYNTWEGLRHTYQCIIMGEQSVRCHMTYNCRKNFPQIFYVMHQLCKLLGYEELLPLYPVDNQKKTLARLNSYWKDICQALLWTYQPLPVVQTTRKRRGRQAAIHRTDETLYTLRRMKKRLKTLRFTRRKRYLELPQLSPVSVPVKKRKGNTEEIILVYDIGTYCVPRRMGESL